MKLLQLCLLTLCLGCSTSNAQNNQAMIYEKQWKEINKLYNEDDLPKSALEKANALYSLTLKDKEYAQALKALNFRAQMMSYIDQDAYPAILKLLKEEAEKLPQPAKSVVYTYLGDFFASYYNTFRYQLGNRTTLEEKPEDFKTWSASQLIDESMKYYLLSVQDEEILQQTPVAEYAAIVEGGSSSRKLLPTLFDLLGLRALNAIKAANFDLARPQAAFIINNPDYFGTIGAYLKMQLPTNDTQSPKYQSMLLYQRLLKFRSKEFMELKDNAILPLVDLELRRLSYLRTAGVYSNVDQLYEQSLKAMLSDNPEGEARSRIVYELAYLYKTQGMSWRATGRDEYRAKLREAYQLCEVALRLKKDDMYYNLKAIQQDVTMPELSFNIEAHQTPNKPILYRASYRNVDTIYFFAYAVKDDEFMNLDSYNFRESLKGKRPVATHQSQTVSQPDYQSYSAELMLSGLDQGTYYIIATNRKDFTAKRSDSDSDLVMSPTRVQVYGLTFTVRNNNGQTMLVYVTDRHTGKPVEGAKVDAYISEYSRSKQAYVEKFSHSGTTESDGTAVLSTQGIGSGSYSYHVSMLKVSHGEKRASGGSSAYGYGERGDYQSNAITLFTDRAIYRPGQTVYFKGLVYTTNGDGDNRIKPREQVTVELFDVNHQKVATQLLVSNEFGSIQGSFTLPQGLLNGMMTIRTSRGGSCGIRVEEYKRPTFEVSFNPITETYKLNQEVKAVGVAKALAGYPVDNAQVQYRVQRMVTYRYYCWWWPPVVAESREIAAGTITTDDKGEFTLSFVALADDVRNDNLIYTYTLTADVTDVTGETRSSRTDVRVSNKPLLLNVEIPQTIQAGEKLSFPLSTTNLNGTPSPANVTVTVHELKSPDRILRKRVWALPDTLGMPREEFVEAFPHDPYGEEDIPNQYPVLKQAASVNLNTASSKEVDLSSLRNAKSGWYRIDLKAVNDKGVEVEQQMYVQLEAAKPEPIRHMDNWFKAVKTIVEPGESAVFTVAGSESTSYVMYEVYAKQKMVGRKVVEVGTTPQRIEVPVKEEHRGGIAVQLTLIQGNRQYSSFNMITVPYTNKMLDVSFTTFRDKLLPGEQEKWTVTVKSKEGEKEMAEMVATLYDASLDTFVPHYWASHSSYYSPRSYYSLGWTNKTSDSPQTSANVIYRGYTGYYQAYYEYIRAIQIVGYFGYYDDFLNGNDVLYEPAIVTAYSAQKSMRVQGMAPVSEVREEAEEMSAVQAAPPSPPENSERVQSKEMDENRQMVPQSGGMAGAEQLTEIATRTNFNETAFFYPQLRTNEKGEIIIEFTIPEALTRWKMMGFAHTKDFKVGTVTNQLITQKEVAISANAPRFFRENDKLVFTAKVNNLTEAPLSGKAMLRLYDATTNQPIDDKLLKGKQTVDITVPAGGSTGVKWSLEIPHSLQAVTYKLTAQAGNHTDGEEKIVPVLTNSMLVTESMPFSARAGQTQAYTFSKLRSHTSSTLRSYRLTLEYTSNPAWNAILALPYLMEYPYECAEQTFSRFYANSLASAVTNSSPKVKQIFDQWNELGSQALISNLEKNQELKQVMIEETPWVMQAKNENERKKRVAVLFDLNRMGNELGRAFNKLSKLQIGNGGFVWFDGMKPDRFITQHIVAGMAHLDRLNALDKRYNVADMISRGLNFLDGEIRRDYDELLDEYDRYVKDCKDANAKIKDKSKHIVIQTQKEWLDAQQINHTQVHYLYASSFSIHKPRNNKQLEAFDYFFAQAEKQWTKRSMYEQAMIALTLSRYGKTDVGKKIITSLKEHAQQSEELGMYWNTNRWGYFWYQAPIETQAILIEAFHEVANDTEAVEEMKIWLLRQKQTTDWRTTKATSEAVYALLMTGSSLLENDKPLEIKLGGKPLADIAVEPIRPEPGTGYVKTAWSGGDVKQEMGDLTATNSNRSGIAWGALYWQYFEQLDKITVAETNLKMTKELFLRTITDKGEVLKPINEKNTLKVGDLVKVRMELRADRDYEYVHLKDMRASTFEPTSTVSGYRWQGGLGYYQSVKDASINFFIGYLPKGTYVFEYELRVTHTGDFSNGITTFQCMYAPEYSAHSEGIRVKVE